MIGLKDRQTMVRHIDTAHAAGARLRPACEVAGITVRTLQRWKAEDGLHEKAHGREIRLWAKAGCDEIASGPAF